MKLVTKVAKSMWDSQFRLMEIKANFKLDLKLVLSLAIILDLL